MNMTSPRSSKPNGASPFGDQFVIDLWILAIPAFILVLFIWWLAPVIFRPLPIEESSQLLKPYSPASGILTLRYVLSVAVVSIGYLSFIGMRSSRRVEGSSKQKSRSVLALSVQAALTAAMVFFSFQEHRRHFEFFSRPLYPMVTWDGLCAVIILGACLLFALRFRESTWLSKLENSGRWLVPAAAFFYCAIPLLSCLYSERFVEGMDPEITWHTSYMMDEAAFALAGKTSLVDYFPVYQNLASYFYLPFFKIFGPSILTFSAVNTLLCGIILLVFIYRVIARLSPGPWRTLCLFVPVVAFTFFPKLQYQGTELIPYSIRYNNFTYLMLGSARYFGPFLILFLLSTYTRKPTRIRRAVMFFVATGVFINNADFGLAASASLIGALGAAEVFSREKSFKSRFATLGSDAVIGFLAGVGAFVGLSWLRSGSLPDLAWLRVPFLMGKLGVLYMEKPPWGYHWIVALALIGGVVIGFLRLRRASAEVGSRDPLGLLLTYVSFVGLIAMPYYLGSSYDENIPALFPFLGLVIVFLIIHSLQSLKNDRVLFLTAVNRLPIAALSVGYLFMVANITNLDSPTANFRRLTSPSASTDPHFIYSGMLEKFPPFMRENADPARPSLIMVPFANTWAYRLGFHDVGAIPVGNDLLRFPQVEKTLEVIRNNPEVIVYTRKPLPGAKPHRTFKAPIRNRLIELGFEDRSRDPAFEMWAKGAVSVK